MNLSEIFQVMLLAAIIFFHWVIFTWSISRLVGKETTPFSLSTLSEIRRDLVA